MDTFAFLQHYWWLLMSITAGTLVFLLFVQGGQGLLYSVGRNREERNRIVASLGRKWESTFTTLVVFGGAFFASFPLFYSTSFGGAFYLWTLILFVFVIQAVAYEFRRKPDNWLGEKTYDAFLLVNGLAGAFLLGVAVGTLFTGGHFIVDRANLTRVGGDTAISQWTTSWGGLEALADYRNLALGLAVLFLSRVLGVQYFLNDIADPAIRKRSRDLLLKNAIPFVFFFLVFVFSLMFSTGYAADPVTGTIRPESYRYWHNLLAMPAVFVLLVSGVVSVLTGIFLCWKKGSPKGIWYSGIGTVMTVTMLFLLAGYRHTAYYPSLADASSSLTIANSSSGRFTLSVMSAVSLLIPVIVWYTWYAWRKMGKEKSLRPGKEEGDAY